MTVRQVQNSDSDLASWDAFVSKERTGSFYHLSGWKKINERELGHRCCFLAKDNDREFTGILPLVLINSKLFGRILCSMPFVNYGGAVASSETVRTELLESAIELADTERTDYLEIRSLEECTSDLPTSLDKVSLTIPLDKDPDAIWKSFNSKHRNNIRRVAKSGVTIRSGAEDLLEDFYSVLSVSWRNLGTPIYRRKFFESILLQFPGQTRVYVAYHNGLPIAATLNGEFNGVVEGMWAGGLPEARTLQANYALYWEMIKDSCERGFETFHLGRSTADSGAETFKKKWGADKRQLYWTFYMPGGGAMPSLNVRNPKYQLAISAWRQLPVSVSQFIGPWFARNIP